MWLYEKLVILDENKRFLNNEDGFGRIKRPFKKNVTFINSRAEDCFKVILSGTKLYESKK